MDAKSRNEVVQARWWLLVAVFSICILFALPAVALSTIGAEFKHPIALYYILYGLILAVPVDTCIVLQINWPLKAKCISILLVTLVFSFSLYLYMIPLLSKVVGVLIYRFILLVCHKLYDGVEPENGATGYKKLSVRKDTLLATTYFGMFFNTITFILGVFAVSFNLPDNPYDPLEVENYRKLISYVPISPLFISPFFALAVQIMSCFQTDWTRRTKIKNIVITEIIFVAVGMIVMLSYYLLLALRWLIFLPVAFFITPLVPFLSCVLLKHIFMKTSCSTLERKE